METSRKDRPMNTEDQSNTWTVRGKTVGPWQAVEEVKPVHKPHGLFATPDSMEDMQAWLEASNDIHVMTGAMMMYNLMCTIK